MSNLEEVLRTSQYPSPVDGEDLASYVTRVALVAGHLTTAHLLATQTPVTVAPRVVDENTIAWAGNLYMKVVDDAGEADDDD